MRARWLLPIVGLLLATRAAAADVAPLPPGTYRLEMRLVSRNAVPLIGTAESTTASLLRVQLRRDGAGFRQTHEVCNMRLEGGVPLVRMTVPSAFVSALGTHEYMLGLEYDPDDGWRYAADLGLEQVGFRGDGEDLPSSAADPRVLDSDRDGQPGATLRLSMVGLVDGELYVVQRGHSALRGHVTALGQASGQIDVREFRQRLLGAHPEFLNRQPEIVVDEARSSFTMVRVADDTPCKDLESAAYDPGPATAARWMARGANPEP
jgi:hypothetical protein